MNAAATRPVLRYRGGKWRLAPWIIAHFPPHRVYVEPYCGAASVLMRKARSYAEVINDLDDEVVNVFRVVRDAQMVSELKRLLELTPFARADFEEAWAQSADPIEQARRTIVRAFMGFGSSAVTERRATKRAGAPSTGFRCNTAEGKVPAHDWSYYPDQIPCFCERLRGVVIENKPAIEVMQRHDAAETLHYVDPPYVMETRDEGEDYAHEMTDESHRELAEVLHQLSGMVVLSGYPSSLYVELYGDWERRERAAMGDGPTPRTECVWLNPPVTKWRKAQVLGL